MANISSYYEFPKYVANGTIDLDTSAIYASLHTSAYTPNRSHTVGSSISGSEVSHAGYTAGGATLGSPALTYTAADSWATARANSTAYVVGDIVRPSTGNGHLYMCIVAGTSAGSAPTWPRTCRRARWRASCSIPVSPRRRTSPSWQGVAWVSTRCGPRVSRWPSASTYT